MMKPRESLILFPVYIMHMVTPLTNDEKGIVYPFQLTK